MGWRNALLLLFALVATPVAAQPRDTLAEVLALPVAGELVGGPSGHIAWVENRAGVRNIFVADAGGAARKVTGFQDDDGLQIYDMAFAPGGSSLAYVRGGDEEFPDAPIPNPTSAAERPKQQVFILPVPGGAAELVGDGHSPVFSADGKRLAWTRRGEIWVREGGTNRKLITVGDEITRLQWSPDGTRLLFVDNHADYSFVGLVEVASAKLTWLDPGLGYSVEPVFSPDGTRVAFIRYLDPPAGASAADGSYWSLRIYDITRGLGRTLWTAPGGRYAGTRMRNLYWSAEGKLVFPWEKTGWIHPYAIDAEKGGEPRELTPGAFEVETFVLAPDGRSLVYAANKGGLDRRHLYRVALDGSGTSQITRGDGSESFPTFAGSTLVTLATSTASPSHVVRAEGLKPLGETPALASFVTPETVRLRAEDGVEFQAQLFRGKGNGKLPALVYVHGGPRRQMLPGYHPMGYYSNAYAMNQHLAAQGYTVLSVNYRSGTGYGRAFRDAPGIARDGASEYRDVLAAGKWLAAREDVDARRIGIWGGSWGGYLTALALARDSDLFAAGVDFHGVHTLLRGTPNSLSPDAQAAARQKMWDASPMGSIDRWRSPVLLIHGDDDRNVDFAQSAMLARELAARRIPYEELVFPNERHEFMTFGHWLASYRATLDFLNRHLRDKK
jgi:dipeptidyl aminopeptidase/acylaminoacyl peptidase